MNNQTKTTSLFAVLAIMAMTFIAMPVSAASQLDITTDIPQMMSFSVQPGTFLLSGLVIGSDNADLAIGNTLNISCNVPAVITISDGDYLLTGHTTFLGRQWYAAGGSTITNHLQNPLMIKAGTTGTYAGYAAPTTLITTTPGTQVLDLYAKQRLEISDVPNIATQKYHAKVLFAASAV